MSDIKIGGSTGKFYALNKVLSCKSEHANCHLAGDEFNTHFDANLSQLLNDEKNHEE